MSWNLKKSLKTKLSREHGSIIKEWGGKTSIALVYPNIYEVGMGNLAVHSLYKMLGDRDDIVCERFFLPSKKDLREHLRTGTPVLSMESQRALRDFDVIAFTISFENDLLNIPAIFEISKIPLRVEDRSDELPIIITGGAAPTLNPLPYSKIFDAVFLGEAECFLDELLDVMVSGDEKGEKISALKSLEGVFKDDPQEKRRYLKEMDEWKTQTVIYSEDAEFGNMHLIEVERGCPYNCKFCATPFIYGRFRERKKEIILKMVEDGIKHRKKMGLIGAHLFAHKDFRGIVDAIHEAGGSFSPSSVRIDDITEENAELLLKSGHRSIALGIEAGTDRLRKLLNKNITNKKIIEAVKVLAEKGILNLRLYFMIGLPHEEEEDVLQIAVLSKEIRAAILRYASKDARTSSVSITISPFIPKPCTPFSKEKFVGERVLKDKIKKIKTIIGREKGMTLNCDSPLQAAVEAYLATADERAVDFIENAYKTKNIRKALLLFYHD